MTSDSSKIKKMRDGGKILAEILGKIIEKVEPGVDTLSLDVRAEQLCNEYDVVPAFLGYEDFPATLCVGPNDVVVHGIPDETILNEGDIISLDMGIIYKDYYLDMARTVGVGEIARADRKFVKTVRKALENAIKQAKTGNRVGDISDAIQSTAEAKGYSVVREMVGHGVGKKLHEKPIIPGYGDPGTGEMLKEGQTIAIEAIINQGGPEIIISREDGWTARTKDGKLSALFENTVVVGKKPEILTPL